MLRLILGALIVVGGFVWMAICASAGWSDAWWFFEWKDFKFVLLGHLLVGGILVAYGGRAILRERKTPRP